MPPLSGADFADWAGDFDDDVHFSAGILLETCLYGLYLPLFITSVYTLLKGGSRSASTIFQLSAFCSIFALSTGLWAINVANLYLSLQTDRLALSPSSTAEQQLDWYITVSDRLIFFSKLLFEINFLIGDLLISWRVLVLYRSRSAVWIRIVFATLWLATIGIVSRETACWAATMLTPDPPLCAVLRQAAWATSLVLNVFASLLTWKFIRQRRTEICASAVKASGFGRTQVDRLLSILMISSSVYITFGLVIFLSECGLGGDRLVELAYLMDQASDQVVGIYPSVVTIFVLCQDVILGPVPSSPTLAMNGTTASIRFNDMANVSNTARFGTSQEAATSDARMTAVHTVHSTPSQGVERAERAA